VSSVHPHAYRRISATVLSVACHVAAVALLLAGVTRATLNKPQHLTFCCVAALQVAGGSRAPRLPLPEAPAANPAAQHPQVQEQVMRPAGPPRERGLARASRTNAAPAQSSDLGTNSVAGNGSDAQNTTSAFPIFSPNPAVRDRSLLPASDRQVVVDVKLNAGGEVVSEDLVRGIGNALDRIVLDIVKTWRFQPATVNGKPLPSEAEVIVDFSQRYPISDP
jgi:TonB family protein